MSATSTKSTWKASTPLSSPSHLRSSHSRPSTTTPHLPPPRTPASVGQSMPPHLSQGASQPSKMKKASSPSYFGLEVAGTSGPPESNPGHNARDNWDYTNGNVRDTPTPVPVDGNPEFEAFRQRSEQGRSDLGHGNPAALSKLEGSRKNSTNVPSSRPLPENPISPRSIVRPPDTSYPARQPNRDAEAGRHGSFSFFDVPRYESPASLSPNFGAAIDHRNARLSLPASNLHTPPSDLDRQLVQRSETLPGTMHKEGPTMVAPQHFVTLLESLPEAVLLLDLRVAPQYSISKIRGALNLCIPTTLMKRPSFNTQKLTDTFSRSVDRERFSRWKDCSFIAVYDSNSNNTKDAQNPTNVLKKFSAEGWKGHGIILKGGFAEVSKSHPHMIDLSSNNAAADTVKSPPSLSPSAPVVAPVSGGCPMPTSKSAANPFFNNIRQNMDLLDGVGQMKISHPVGMSARSESTLPEWLRKAVAVKDNGKLVSDNFLAIERQEQKRMQDALSTTVSYGSPSFERPGKVRIAGIEKGAKNRYNNIFPYDHSRVHLQDTDAGGCDYINANHIRAAYSNKRYIATQAPIPATFNDFWRLIWEQETRVIVMLTAELEGGQLKSHPYWKTGNYGPLKLTLLSEKRIPLELNNSTLQTPQTKRPRMGERQSTNSPMEVNKASIKEAIQAPMETPFVIVRHFTISHSGLPFQPMREITQLQYTQWPDFGAPAHPQHLLALIEQTSKYASNRASPNRHTPGPAGPVPKGQRPVLVHCSAGCGRTGTFCTVDSVVDMLKRQRAEQGRDRMNVDSNDDFQAGEWLHGGDLDLIAKTVEDFRGQRLSMVQSLRQFVLCYETVLDWMAEQQMIDEGVAGEGGW